MTSWPLILVLAGTLWLAWNNGANDNFKGVATLYGSGALSFRAALWLATAATLAGSLVSVWLAQGLVQTFSGHGLIAAGTLNDAMLAAVGIGAGATVLLATRLGMPTSTTHAFTGALLGAALMVNAQTIDWAALSHKFAQPLLLGPLLAIGLTLLLYPLLHRWRQKLEISDASCVCVGVSPAVGAQPSSALALSASALSLEVGEMPDCAEHYGGRFVGMDAHTAVNTLHLFSAGSVCFARAVNDTPKIAGLLLAASALGGGPGPAWVFVLVAVAMTAGGWLHGGRVAETLSRRITQLDHGQGLTANLITAGLVLGASHLGLPVSTTHVATGAIFGIGAVNGRRNWRTVRHILLAWTATLPLGLVLGAGLYATLAAWSGA